MNFKCKFIVGFYRLTNYFCTSPYLFLRTVLGIPLQVLYKLIVEYLLSVEIPAKLSIGENLILHHGMNIVININSVIGKNCVIKHNVTIGSRYCNDKMKYVCPTIGDDVIINPHVVIFGDCTIGNNVIVGAGSVVFRDVEDNAIVAGNPAKVIGYRNSERIYEL